MDSYYVLSLNILKALGGDTSIIYPDADAIWDEINKIYNNAGNRFDIVPLEKNITENGQYDYYPDGDADAFMPVNINVNVPQKYTDEQVFEIESNAIQQGYNQGYVEGEAEGKLTGREEGYTDGYNTGYGTGVTDGGNAQKAKLVDITITENGTYTKDDGYKTVTVEIEAGIPEEELQQMLQEAMDEGYQDGYAEGVDDGREDGIAEQKEKLESTTFRANGTYTKEDGWNEVTVQVNVPTFETETLSVELKSNGNYNYTPTTDGYSSVSVTVDVPTSGGGDTGKPKIYNGFKLLSRDSSLTAADRNADNLHNVDFSQYDWSGMYDMSRFFGDFKASAFTDDKYWYDSDFNNFREHFNGAIVIGDYLFSAEDNSTLYAPLCEVPDFSKFTSDLASLSYTFYNCRQLTDATNIAKWNTSNVVDMSGMFYGCDKLTTVPLFDTSNACTMSGMFYGCGKITTIPEFDFSNVTDLGNFFTNCSNLKTIPNVNCYNLPTFYNNYSFISSSCTNLESIGEVRCDSITNFQNFIPTELKKLTYFGGAINLGKQPSVSNLTNVFNRCPNLTHESVMNIINGLYDRATVGYSVLTLKMHANHLAMLSDEEIAIATNKGWTLS